MNANVRRLIDLGSIYIKGIATSGKIPPLFSMRSSTVGFALYRRTWGTRSRKNLMKACHACRSVKSLSWAVKKAYTQVEVMYNAHRLTRLTLRSSFLPEEPKRGIPRGYCRDSRLRNSLSMYTLGLGPNPRM